MMIVEPFLEKKGRFDKNKALKVESKKVRRFIV